MLLVAAALVLALDGAPPFPQYPSAAPDGSWIVFSSAGDLWAVRPAGGRAWRLTSHPALELGSAFSPDGRSLAFESDRTGTRQIHVATLRELDGELLLGEARQVTHGDRDKGLCSFSHDGSEIVFTSGHEPDAYRAPSLYRVRADGGPITELFQAHGADARALPDGSGWVFVRGRGTPERPGYRGTGTSSLWRHDTALNGFWPLESSAGNDHAPWPLPGGGLLFLSSRDGQNDLWLSTASGGSGPIFAPRATAEELTIGHGLRDLAVSADGSLAVACLWDRLVVVDPRTRDSRVLDIDVGTALERDPLLVVDASRSVDACALSPDGKTMAAIARGEVFIRAVAEGRPSRRVTFDSDRASDLCWAPDGSALYFTSDGSDGHVLWRVTVRTTRGDLKPVVEDAPEETEEESEEQSDTTEEAVDEGAQEEAQEAGDGEASDDAEASDEGEKEPKIDHGARFEDALEFDLEVVYTASGTLSTPRFSPNGARIALVEGRGDLVILDADSGAARTVLAGWNEPEVVWLADSRHVVLSFSDLDFNADVHLFDIDGDAPPYNLTRHPDLDRRPSISADGKVLAFVSDRHGANFEYDVYTLRLDRALDALQPFELDEHFEKAAKGVKWPAHDDDAPVLAFDLHECWLRATRVTSLPGSESDVILTAGGDRVIFSGTVGEESGLWSVDHRGGDRKLLTSGSVGDVRLSLDGKRLSFVQSGQARHMAVSGGKAETVSIDGRLRVPVADEQNQKFREACHVVGERFYHPTLKGLDWQRLTARYTELAVTARTSQEFSRIGNLLFGELDGSHLALSGGPSFSGPGEETGYLGLELAPAAGGYSVTRVLPDSPAALGARPLVVGDLLTAVDGRSFVEGDGEPTEDWRAAMEVRRDQEVVLDVKRVDGTLERLLMRTVSFGRIADLRYDDEIRNRRARVEELSHGRLGYLHIRGMSQPYVRDFERDLYAAAAGKEGLVIDVRDNGGGSTADILLASLTAPRHAYTVPRGADPKATPPDAYPRDRRLIHAYTRPIIVLINENSFSNAEIFAHAIRTTGRGRLVGVTTFGGVISTGGTRLVDGTRVRLPFRGWYLPDGTDMENNGAQPHVEVPRLPSDEQLGIDAQLERAVEELLAELPL